MIYCADDPVFAESPEEMSGDAVLLCSGIGQARDPAGVAIAMKHAIIAGRAAFLAASMPRNYASADASSPMTGIIGR